MATRSGRQRRPSLGASPALWGGIGNGDLVLVDSAPLIYLLDDHPSSPRFEGLFEAYEQGQVQIAISTIAIAEVLAGPFKHGKDVLAKRYETALGGF